VLIPLGVVLDPHQGCDLVHTRRIGHLFGDHLIEPLCREDLDRIFVELCPVALHLVQRGHLVRPEVVGDGRQVGTKLDVE